jgi:Fe-S-cluster-containing dehydrogenase component
MQNDVCMVIDVDRCWGCRACEVACKQELNLGVGPRPMWVVDIGPRSLAGKLHKDSVPTMCQHCDQPACLDACPSGAIYRESDGTVQIDSDSCNGCATCREACSFGTLEEFAMEGRMVKCTLCFQRRQEAGVPSCAQHCLGRVFTMTTQSELETVIAGRHTWSRGRIVYVSSKWAGLGDELSPAAH